MNAGGLATVQPITQTPLAERSSQQVKMTCDGETLSAASLELRARFAGSLEKMKVVAERAKQRQDAARPALIKREREDQQKYHRRYMESAMKQHAEQQAKSREVNGSVMHPIMNSNQRTSMMPHGYTRFAPAPGAAVALLTNTPTSTATRAHNRKRQFEQMQSWSQQASLCSPMGVLPPATHMQRAFSTPHIHAELTSSSEMISQQQQSHRGVVYPESSMSIPCQSMDISASSSPSACPLQSLSMDRSSSATDIKPIIGRCSSDSLPPSTITSPEGIGEVQNETAIPELADSQMKNLMDQFGPGNPLSDLGDGCLDGVLAAHSEHDEQPSTSTQSVPSEITHSPMNHSIASVNSNSIVSPSSLGSGTPNGAVAPTSIQSAVRDISNSVCNARADPSTSMHNISSNGAATEVFCGEPLGAPLDSSTPSTSSNSCCYSQMQSTSAFPPSCAASGQQSPRVPYPVDVLRQSHCDRRQQQHQMMISNQQVQMPHTQQRYIYACMNSPAQHMYDSNALLRMRQSVEDLSTNVEKRVAFAPRFAPSSGVDYTSLQLKQAVQDEQSYASAHVPYPHSNRQMQNVAAPNQQVFATYQMHPQQSNIQSMRTPDYSYPMRMSQTMNHQMAMYHMNGQIVTQQQPFAQQYFPSRNIYNYRYC
uniref:MamL-1 domain-containing protein n=1 Tax=Ascaris lumbricoides TaxID=6252 RepID=A0A0M3HU55_ASCLU